MEYISHRSGGQFNRRKPVVDLNQERTKRKAGAARHLLSVAAIVAVVGAGVPTGWHLLSGQSPTTGDVTPLAVMQQTSIDICYAGDRQARKVTCIVDGDTGWEAGVKWRLYSVDTPELSNPTCSNERSKAIAARDRLRELMRSGYSIEWMGSSGNYGRKLVRIRLADGRYAGQILMQEGLAQPWPNTGNVWCNQSQGLSNPTANEWQLCGQFCLSSDTS